MATKLAASIIDLVMGTTLGSTGPDSSNRVSLEGLTFGPGQDGTLEIAVRKLEATSLRLASGPLVLEVGRLALHGLVALVRIEAGTPSLRALEATSAELSAVKVSGPLAFARQPKETSWCLQPLAAADGTIRAEILDAHLLFDAEVTVPIRQGQIDFNDATVEHVGPDSRMGVSRLGLYVDAPNGRSYLYQFPSAPVAGVHYEQRGALLGPWVTSRGNLRLQAFGEALLRQLGGGQAVGVTEQARLLFDRTAVSGDVQLGDGRFAAPGLQADMVGRADGRNTIRLHSEAVGRGLAVEIASLRVREAVWDLGNSQLGCDEMAGTFTLRLFVEQAQLRFAFDVANTRLSKMHLHPRGPRNP